MMMTKVKVVGTTIFLDMKVKKDDEYDVSIGLFRPGSSTIALNTTVIICFP